MNRRSFLSALPVTVTLPVLGAQLPFFPKLQEPTDRDICMQKFDIALSLGLKDEPIGDVIVEIGKSFVGTPYLAHALEQSGEERLIVNMRGLDCVSFYENALVLARCIKKETTTFEAYKKELQFIRYRGGIIDGYASRLHYTSDYIYDNDVKKVWKDVTKDIGGIIYSKTIDFMSTHPDAYRQIRESKKVLGQIITREKELGARTIYYIPKRDVEAAVPKLRNGDILGITTSFEGLDTSHTGILVYEHGRTSFLHAPLAGKKVVQTESSLPEYLRRNKKQTGIIVARPNEV
jgi:hypothetical protein